MYEPQITPWPTAKFLIFFKLLSEEKKTKQKPALLIILTICHYLGFKEGLYCFKPTFVLNTSVNEAQKWTERLSGRIIVCGDDSSFPFQLCHSEDTKLLPRPSSLPGLKDRFNFVQLSNLMANSNNAEHKHLDSLWESFPSFGRRGPNQSERCGRAFSLLPWTEKLNGKVFYDVRREADNK